MEYNSQTPKLPGDIIEGIGMIPVGGLYLLRDEHLPISAYDRLVPRAVSYTHLTLPTIYSV